MQRLIFVRHGGDRDDPADTAVMAAERSPALRYVLNSPRGLGAVGTRKLSSAAAGMDGEYWQGVELEPRTVTDTVTVQGRTRAEMYENRMALERILDPHQGLGTLYYINDLGQWQIRALPLVYGEALERISGNRCRVSVSFYCPDPYWTDIASQKLYLSKKAERGITLPAVLDAELPADTENRYLMNLSGVEAFTRITVTGPAKGVGIVNRTTGELLRLDRVLEDGDTVVLDSKEHTAVHTRHNGGATELLVPRYGYRFLTLRPGVNHIVVDWDHALPGAGAVIEWICRYAGV